MIYSTGDQGETYRNLGFLLNSHEEHATTQGNVCQPPVSDPTGTQTPDEWSQWFGHPTELEDGQENK